MSVAMTPADWLGLLTHFATLSLLAVGGAITTTPDMHRYLVDQQGWMTDSQFTNSVAIAQAAPGPNVLFVALMGWQVGMNALGWPGACLGLVITMVGMLVPSSLLSVMTAQWSHRNRERRGVRAFKQGMTPIVMALMISTGVLLATQGGHGLADWPLWATSIVATLVVWRTRIHLLWLLGAGAVLGALGWI